MTTNNTRIRRIFFDTNVLHQTWPGISASVQNAMTAAHKLGISIEIPHPVMMELERNWRERVEKRVDSLQEIYTSIDSVMPSHDQIFTAYPGRVSALIERWAIHVTPMPSIPVQQVFEQAISRDLVFGEQGRNFQDVVIFHSIVERMQTCYGEPAVLISKDGIFHERQQVLRDFASSRGVSLDLWKLDRAERVLGDLLGDQAKSRLVHHKELAKTALSTAIPGVQISVSKALKDQIRYRASVVRSGNFRVEDIVDVDVSALADEPQPGAQVQISATFRGTLEVVSPATVTEFQPRRTPMDVGVNANAIYDGSSYLIKSMNMSYAWNEY